MKGVARGLRRDVQQMLKAQTKRRCRTEATACRDGLNELVRRLQRMLSQHNALLKQPAD